MVVVLELGHRKEFVPIVLPFTYEQAQVLFQLLVYSFGLSIRLRVVGRGGRESDTE